MEKREYKVSEIFENQVLNDIYEIRREGLESLYIAMYGEPEEIREKEQARKKLEDLMKELVKDKEKQKELWLKIDEFECCMTNEMTFWDKQYYKLGFLDRIYLQKEITDSKNKFINSEVGDLKDTFIYKCMFFIKEMIGRNIWRRKDYKEIAHKIDKIKDEYPNVTNFLERDDIVELTKKEIKALSEYLILADEMRDIELIEAFKLGLKDNSLL